MSDLKDSKDTKAKLIASSLQVFGSKGYAGTSVKEIAESAGVNSALISYHFGGKEGLYQACFDQFVKEWTEFLESKILRPTSKEDFYFRLRLMVEHMVDDYLKNPHACRIMKREIESEGSEAQEVFQKVAGQFFELVTGFIKSAQKQNYLRSDIHAADVCAVFFGGIQHALHTSQLREKIMGDSLSDPKVRARFVNSVLEMFLNGLTERK